VAFTRWGVAIFVDGAFWHGHPDHFTPGKLGTYWDQKVATTQRRDTEQNGALRLLGYRVMRFWDFEIKGDVERCVDQIELALSKRGRPRPASGAERTIAVHARSDIAGAVRGGRRTSSRP